jgi:hypothetical protein
MDKATKNMIAYIPSACLSKVGDGDSSLSQCVW